MADIKALPLATGNNLPRLYVDNGDGTYSEQVAASVSATAQTVATATAAAPSYSEGQTDAPLSVDLDGGLRITGTINATSSIHATAADPSYVEGSDNAFSSDLAGYQRVKAKQSGTWTVGLSAGTNIIGKVAIDQTTPGTTNLIDANNFPDTLDVNSGNKSNSTIRVVLATDQPQLTNKLLVTPDLPSGASTAAKQPALGTAGSASADVITVQGIASMTPFLCAQSGTWNITTVTSLTQFNGNAIDTNSGNKSAGTLRTVLATDSPAIALHGHGATGSSVPANAVLRGLRAATANPTAVTDGQMVGAMADKLGRQVVVNAGIRDNITDGLGSATGTSETDIIAAGGANVFLDLVGLILENSGSTAVEVSIRDAAAGSVRFYVYVPAGDTRGITLPVPIKQTTANNKWTFQSSGSTTTLRVFGQFVKNL